MKLIFAFIFRLLKPYRWKVVFYLSLLVGITFLTLIEPYIYKLIIDNLTSVINMNTIITYLLLWAGVSFLGLVLYSLYRYKMDMLYLSVYRDYMIYAFHKVVRFDVRKHLENKSGETIKRIDNAGDALFFLLLESSISILPSWFSFVAVIAFATSLHWQMTLIAASLIPFYIFIFIFGGMKTGKKQEISTDNWNAAIGRAYDAVANIQVVKSFAEEHRELSLFQRLIEEATLYQRKVSFFWSMLGSAEFFLGILNRFIIFGAGIYFITTQHMSVGTMIMFLAFSGYIYNPLQVLGSQIQGLQRRVIDLKKAMDVLEHVPEVLDIPHAKTMRIKEGKIEVQDVTFAYNPKKIILHHVCFSVPAGKITAIVGHSGAGKSTIIGLMNRFYDIQKGKILIDQQNIKEVTQESLRKNIGMVMQENSMFNDTIYHNIHYGNPKASKQRVIEAAKKAKIHDFILSLPDKYETKVGERGLKLSGGEKQRVAIARVILKNPPILILDEATSSLDSETEKDIQAALEIVMKNRTTIVIAHRLSTVRKADQIIVFEKGRVVEIGTHQELMDQSGIYKRLVDLQVAGFLSK